MVDSEVESRSSGLPFFADGEGVASVPCGAAEEWETMTAVRLRDQALDLPDVRLDKIALVRSALANGSYRIRASELASKVMDSMVRSTSRQKP
ncbi:MAG TPA: flagellar biosynthesis anti-sigma factor FlgM [Acidisarcina sp.]